MCWKHWPIFAHRVCINLYWFEFSVLLSKFMTLDKSWKGLMRSTQTPIVDFCLHTIFCYLNDSVNLIICRPIELIAETYFSISTFVWLRSIKAKFRKLVNFKQLVTSTYLLIGVLNHNRDFCSLPWSRKLAYLRVTCKCF